MVQMSRQLLKGGNIKCEGENCPFVVCYRCSTKRLLMTMTLINSHVKRGLKDRVLRIQRKSTVQACCEKIKEK